MEDKFSQLVGMRHKVLEEIARAARTGDTAGVVSGSRKLEGIEELIERCESLKREIDLLDTYSDKMPTQQYGSVDTGNKRNRLSPSSGPTVLSARAKGQKARVYLFDLLASKGITLKEIGNQLYQSENKKRVCIAYASERSPNRWWFGPPTKQFDFLVLVCETDPLGYLIFIVPHSFLTSHKSRLIDPKRPRWLFTINKRRQTYAISPKEGEALVLNEFINDWKGLS